MNVIDDVEGGAAHASFVAFAGCEVTQQSSVMNAPNGQTQISLDFARVGYLLGVEILALLQGCVTVLWKTWKASSYVPSIYPRDRR